MCPMSAAHPRYRLFCGGMVFSLVCSLIASAQNARETAPLQLYLFSATPTEHTDKTYPAILYRVSVDRKLKAVREVVSQAEGVRLVQAWTDAIFVDSPPVPATFVSIIHTNDPLRQDRVKFNPQGLNLNNSATVIAQTQLASSSQLLPLLAGFSDPAHLRGNLVSVPSNLSELGSRLKIDTWDEYASLRHQGSQGGPALVAGLIGSISGQNLAMSVYGHSIVIDGLPPELRATGREIVPVIACASQQYLVLLVQRTREEMSSPNLGDFRELFVHDRTQDRWKILRTDGNSSGFRLFSQWLTTIVGMWNPDHKPSPGRENERNSSTDRLPNVQQEYATFSGRWNWKPGILVLQNLADGRKIRIETGQEDSEVLVIQEDAVLYRVNDTIYQAKIAGDQLKDPTIVVKDEDVPEIHWVFWSK
jgi:hypothetical protein